MVDWPGELDDVLNAAILAQVAKAIKPERYDQLNRDFYKVCTEAENKDRLAPGLMRFSRGKRVSRGPAWRWG